jgi:phosphoribosylformylglycinamidine synthase subunit PurL
VTINMTMAKADPFDIKERLFSEIASSVIVTAEAEKVAEIRAVLADHPGVFVAPLGEVTSGNYKIVINEQVIIDQPVQQLKAPYASALDSQLAAEVLH